MRFKTIQAVSEIERVIEGFNCANTPENEDNFLQKIWSFESGCPTPQLLYDWLENDSMPPERHQEYALFAMMVLAYKSKIEK